jgi:hypothetical protein
MSDMPTIPVLAARALTTIYQMGEVTVQALRGVDVDLFPASCSSNSCCPSQPHILDRSQN